MARKYPEEDDSAARPKSSAKNESEKKTVSLVTSLPMRAEQFSNQKTKIDGLKIQLDMGTRLNANDQVDAIVRQASKNFSRRSDIDFDDFNTASNRKTPVKRQSKKTVNNPSAKKVDARRMKVEQLANFVSAENTNKE